MLIRGNHTVLTYQRSNAPTCYRADVLTPSPHRKRSRDPLKVLDQSQKLPVGFVDQCLNGGQLTIPYLENHVTGGPEISRRLGQQPPVERQSIRTAVKGGSRLKIPNISLHQIRPVRRNIWRIAGNEIYTLFHPVLCKRREKVTCQKVDPVSDAVSRGILSGHIERRLRYVSRDDPGHSHVHRKGNGDAARSCPYIYDEWAVLTS